MDLIELDKAYRASEVDKLFKLCKNILKKDKNNLHARYYMALGYRKKGDLDQSVNILDQMVRENPNDPDFWAERGVSNLHLNNGQEAIEDFNMALILDSNNPYRYSSRAFAKAHFKDIDGAIKDYQEALKLDPEDATVLNNLGLLEEQQGRKESAKALYSKSDEILGVKYTDPKDIPLDNKEETKVDTQEKPPLTLSFYVKTVKEVLFTSEGRKEFFTFFKDKLKKKQ